MRTKNFKKTIKKVTAAILASALILTADMGVVFAQDLENVPAAVSEMADSEEVSVLSEAMEAAAAETEIEIEAEETNTNTVEEEAIAAQEDPCAQGHTLYEKVKKATLTADGQLSEYCSVCGKRITKTTIPHPVSIKLEKTSYAYTGKYIKPVVLVSNADGEIDPANYTVTYTKNKSVGEAKATVTFNDVYYKGISELAFTIKPMDTTITSLTPSTTVKTLNVKWEKVPAQLSGYQIQYATSSKFSSAHTFKIAGNETFSTSIKKLEEGKKYYVRIRTYKTVGSKTYCSAWSKALTATTYTADEIAAWKSVANVLKNGKAQNYSTMNTYLVSASYEPYTSAEKVFYNIFKDENAKSYSYKLLSSTAKSSSTVTVEVQISCKNYYEAVYDAYMKTVEDVEKSGNEKASYIYNCLKKYTLDAANNNYPPFKSKYTAQITVVKKKGVWKVKKIPEMVENTFNCFAEMGISFAENDLLDGK